MAEIKLSDIKMETIIKRDEIEFLTPGIQKEVEKMAMQMRENLDHQITKSFGVSFLMAKPMKDITPDDDA